HAQARNGFLVLGIDGQVESAGRLDDQDAAAVEEFDGAPQRILPFPLVRAVRKAQARSAVGTRDARKAVATRRRCLEFHTTRGAIARGRTRGRAGRVVRAARGGLDDRGAVPLSGRIGELPHAGGADRGITAKGKHRGYAGESGEGPPDRQGSALDVSIFVRNDPWSGCRRRGEGLPGCGARAFFGGKSACARDRANRTGPGTPHPDRSGALARGGSGRAAALFRGGGEGKSTRG